MGDEAQPYMAVKAGLQKEVKAEFDSTKGIENALCMELQINQLL